MFKKFKRITLFIFAAVVLCSCGENGIFSPNSSSNAVDGSSQWPSQNFPLKIGISSDFSQQDYQGMAQVGHEWTKAHGREEFFEFESVNSKSVGHLEDYEDGTLGIYKMHTMLPGYPEGSALAVTQVYADRVNYGGKSYFTIRHADIIVNYVDYNFTNGNSFGAYDLKTVILHELGHLLGLGHFQEKGSSSIMEPSIDTYDRIHYPFDIDKTLVRNNYPVEEQVETNALRSIASLSPSENMIVIDPEHDSPNKEVGSKINSEQPEIIERNVRIVHQLNADKTCVHYVNGKKVHSHSTQDHTNYSSHNKSFFFETLSRIFIKELQI